MVAIAIGSHIGPPPNHSGSNPPTVVAVVNRIGLSLFWAASTTAFDGSIPFSSISILMRPSHTIALLMTIPDSEMIPSSVTGDHREARMRTDIDSQVLDIWERRRALSAA